MSIDMVRMRMKLDERDAEIERLRAQIDEFLLANNAKEMTILKLRAELEELKTPASRKLSNITKAALENAEVECARLGAALEGARELIAAIYTLEPLSADGKRLLLEERDVIDKVLANEQRKSTPPPSSVNMWDE